MTFAPSRLDSAEFTQSPAELAQERAAKQQRLREFLDARNLNALLIRRNENLAWITAGAIDRRVLLPSDTGIPTLLLRGDSKVLVLVPNNEFQRLADEDLPSLGYETVVFPWHESVSGTRLQQLAGDRVAADIPTPGATLVNLAPLRAPLLETEITRYRWLARATAEATTSVLLSLTPGTSEPEMNARVAYELWRRRIEPSVLLMAVDDRIRRYKHALAHTARLEKYGMVNLCARRWGLAVSITRFVHFGPIPADLADRFAASAFVNARLLHATRAGRTAAQLFAVAADAYREAGFPGEEAHHHQGGPTGYAEREWVATPNGTETVTDPEAFAWNPSIQGGKVEDTTLLRHGRIEVLTETPQLPIAQTKVDADTYTSAGVLIR
jgi:Xaa-Pro dipeptidase